MTTTRHPGRLVVLAAALTHHGTDADLPAFPLEVAYTDAEGGGCVLTFTRSDLARCYELGLLPRPGAASPPVPPAADLPQAPAGPPPAPATDPLLFAPDWQQQWAAIGLRRRHQVLWLAATDEPISRRLLIRRSGFADSSYTHTAITLLIREGFLIQTADGVRRGPCPFPLAPDA